MVAGAYRDIKLEIERRFHQLPVAKMRVDVGDCEVEILLTVMGRADNAYQVLSVIAPLTGKFQVRQKSLWQRSLLK